MHTVLRFFKSNHGGNSIQIKQRSHSQSREHSIAHLLAVENNGMSIRFRAGAKSANPNVRPPLTEMSDTVGKRRLRGLQALRKLLLLTLKLGQQRCKVFSEGPSVSCLPRSGVRTTFGIPKSKTPGSFPPNLKIGIIPVFVVSR